MDQIYVTRCNKEGIGGFMRQQHHTPSRLNFEFPEGARKMLKMQAIRLGMSVCELATEAIMEKLETLEMEEDIAAYDRAINKYKKGKMQTISHEQMIKRVGWDEL
jgi:Family of unknown function (DUF6290)